MRSPRKREFPKGKSHKNPKGPRNQTRKKPSNRPEKTPEEEKGIRLNRFIANAGVCSRREADQLIKAGRVKVNGKKNLELGTRLQSSDKVEVDGKAISGEKKVYILLNKPKDFITTLKDTHNRKIVTDLIKGKIDERVYPVGRLDRLTTGVLLLTNDGDLADVLMHPSSRVSKVYSVELDKPLSREHETAIIAGSKLEDGVFAPDELASISDGREEWGIEIHSGKNRIVRRLFESYGYKIKKLDRVVFAGLTKKNLSRGQWRFLTDKEIVRLKYLKRH